MRPATLFLAACFLLFAAPAAAQDALPTIDEKTAGAERQAGFVPAYWMANEGKVYLEVERLGEDFIYQVSLPAGLGSNDIGLDRGQLGPTRLVRFERAGPRVLLVAPNLAYRATTDNPSEARAVRDAFAESVVWAFDVVAETDGTLLVDATDFVVRDAHRAAERLKDTGQGTFRLDERRSAPYPDVLKAFPRNTELEARLTFTSDDPGRYVRDVAADPYAVTLRVRHSFVQLPDSGYAPRPFHPGSGYFYVGYADYAVPIGEELTQRLIARHRLEKRDPSAAVSPPVEPIVYYLDAGTPEPVRSALLDGARWWAEAFEAAGFQDAFRVEVLPDSADPLDVRYNVIQWVHRATRGWSYGASVVDPRTGEIIKGHVSLGSLRVRQDYLLAEGMLAPYADSLAAGYPPDDDPMLAMALARLRQLSAHEIGHTLGLAHNFAASVNGRASVMDYPAPLATVGVDGGVALDSAYASGIGAWDKLAIRYGYAQPATPESEDALLRSVLADAYSEGLLYITDRDARPAGGAQPLANLWDNGTNMIDALSREMAVRRAALSRFGLSVIREGRPVATLEEALVPLYLRHRYQVEATVKLLGGLSYSYAMRDGARALPSPVPGRAQRVALDSLLATITPATLALPERIRTALPPRPPGYGDTRELFEGYAGLPFDAYAPAEMASSLVLGLVAHPERAARLVYQHDANPSLPSFQDVLVAVSDALFEAAQPSEAYEAELQRVTQGVWVDVLLGLASTPSAAPAVRARATDHLRTLSGWLADNPGRSRDKETVAHRAYLFDQIDRYLLRLYDRTAPDAELAVPPGSPIGMSAPGYWLRQQRRQAWLDVQAPVCLGDRE